MSVPSGSAEHRGVAGSGSDIEPDYRFTLANERTFLAWLRTSLAFLAGAVAVVQLAQEFPVSWARQALGLALTVLSIASAGIGVWRWRVVDAAMRAGDPLPRFRAPWVLSAAIAVVAVGAVVLWLVR